MGGSGCGESRRPGTRVWRGVRGWHRWLGLLSALPVVVISVTGLLLNHGVALRLDQRMVEAGWLSEWYGLSPRGEPRMFALDGAGGRPVDWGAEWGGRVVYQGKPVGNLGRVCAAGLFGEEVAVAGDEGILLLNREAEVLEQVHASMLPPGTIRRLGEREGEPVIETSEGVFLIRHWAASDKTDGAGIRWFPGPSEPAAAERAEVERAFRAAALSLSRLVLDIHSGRFWGRAGVVIYDLAAGLFLALVATGIVLALRRAR